MIILEKPHMSKLMEDTFVEFQFPVLKNKAADELNISSRVNFWDEQFGVSELRKIDYKKYTVFAFAFIKTENYSEIENILTADFAKYF